MVEFTSGIRVERSSMRNFTAKQKCGPQNFVHHRGFLIPASLNKNSKNIIHLLIKSHIQNHVWNNIILRGRNEVGPASLVLLFVVSIPNISSVFRSGLITETHGVCPSYHCSCSVFLFNSRFKLSGMKFLSEKKTFRNILIF